MKTWRRFWRRVEREPVLISEWAKALLVLLMSYGLPMTKEQMGLALIFIGTTLALVTRRQVTPTRGKGGATDG